MKKSKSTKPAKTLLVFSQKCTIDKFFRLWYYLSKEKLMDKETRKKTYSLRRSLKSPEINFYIKNHKAVNNSNNLTKQAEFAKTRDHTIKFLLSSYKVLSGRLVAALTNYITENEVHKDMTAMVEDFAFPEGLQKMNNKTSRNLISSSMHLLAHANNISNSGYIQNLDNFICESLVNIKEVVEETSKIIDGVAKEIPLPKDVYISTLAIIHHYETMVFALLQLKKVNQRYYINILEKQDLEFYSGK